VDDRVELSNIIEQIKEEIRYNYKQIEFKRAIIKLLMEAEVHQNQANDVDELNEKTNRICDNICDKTYNKTSKIKRQKL
jgi:hypothetical protein